jgi:UDP-N-acetylmuramoyl-tripeptide--D-alanyl-D-alanine ligase
MGELGSQARSYHQEVGEYAKACNIDDLLTIGVLSQSTADAFNGKHFSERSQLMHCLISLLENEQQNISILVKGSRSARMENVVKDIMNWCENTEKNLSVLKNNSSEKSSC